MLELLAEAPGGCGVTDLARRLGLDKGNAHRLLGVLARRGYVVQDPTTRRWAASTALVALAGGVLRQLDVVTVARRTLVELCEATGESAHLAVWTGATAVYLAQERPVGRVSVETEIGSRPVLHATATGKALLAALEDDVWPALVPEPLAACTGSTCTSVAALAEELTRTRRRGWSVDDEEHVDGIRCVAATVRDVHGALVATIGLSGPAERIPKRRIPELGRAVLAAATTVTGLLGGAR